MKSITQLLMAIFILLSTASNAQIKNSKTETVKIYGNCSMCKGNIEQAGSKKKIAIINWNEDTKIATITYNSKKTNQDEILKRIALAGYDNDKFLAPDEAYNQLEGCCQYKRISKIIPKTEEPKMVMHEHSKIDSLPKKEEKVQEINQLQAVFDNYFSLKDALVKTDGNTASANATTLLASLKAVKMEKLTSEEHIVWMKVMKDLMFDTEHISETKEISHQRDHFTTLSKNMYELIKVSKTETPTYYQFCPMANSGKGANWLSKENAVKNPYYGSQMMTCGKTVETIK